MNAEVWHAQDGFKARRVNAYQCVENSCHNLDWENPQFHYAHAQDLKMYYDSRLFLGGFSGV